MKLALLCALTCLNLARVTIVSAATSTDVSPVFTVDLRGDSIAVAGRVLDAKTRTPISGATITLAGQTISSSGPGTFSFLSVYLSAGNILEISKTDYTTYSGPVAVPPGATEVVVPDIFLKPNTNVPVVTAINPKYEGIFLGDLSLQNDYRVTVNWNGLTPGSVEFRANGNLVTTVATSGTEAVGILDMGRDFKSAFREGDNKLSVVAVSSTGTRSEPATRPVRVIPIPNWLVSPVKKLSVQINYDDSDPGYSVEMQYPDDDVPASALRDLPLLKRFGAEWALGGGFEYSISSGEWQVYAGAAPYGRWAGRRGQRPRTKLLRPKFYLGNRSLDFGIYGFGSGIATQEQGIQIQKFGVKLTLEYKAEILTIYLTDWVPGAQWARVLDELAKVGFDINSLQRLRVYGMLNLDLQPYLRLDPPPIRYGGFMFGCAAGLEIAYEPDLGLAKGRVYAGGQAEEKFDWPIGQSLSVTEIKAALYGGIMFSLLGYELVNETFTLLQYKWPPPGPIQAALQSGLYKKVTLDGQDWISVPVESSGFRPMPRPYLESGMEQFVAGESAALVSSVAGLSSLEAFRQISRSPAVGESGKASVAAALPGATTSLAAVDLALVANVFPNSEPALAKRGQELMLVYVSDNGSTNSLQFTDIRWSRFDGTNWSVPAAIQTNTQAEFAPKVAYDGNGDAIAVWQRVADPNFNQTNLTALLAQMEIVWSRWSRSNGQWSVPQALTANGYLDHSPMVCGPMKNGSVLATWTANTSNLLMGTNGAGSQVLWAEWNPTNQNWSAPQTLIADLPNRLSQSLSGVSNRAVYAWTRDLDGAVTNANDQQVYYSSWSNGVWSAAAQLTAGTNGNGNVQVAVGTNARSYLVWQSGTNLVLSQDFSTNVTLVRADSLTAGFADYAMTIGPAGNLVLLWQDKSEQGSDAYYIVFDPASATWSKDAQLFHDAPLERSFAPAWDEVGNLTVAYNKVQTFYTNQTVTLVGGDSVTITNVPTSGQVDLYVTKRQIIKDVTVAAGDFTADAENYLPGAAVTLTATLRNSGDLAVSNAVVGFYDGNPTNGGVLISNVVISGWLEGAASNTVSAIWVVPEPATNHVLYAVADPAGAITEFDESNNKQSLSVGGTDLMVTLVSQTPETNGALRVIAQVQNLGAPSATNSVLAIRRAGETNAPLATVAVPLLEPGRLAQVAFDLPAGTQPQSEALYTLKTDEGGMINDVDTNNNVATFAVNLVIDSDGDGIPDSWEIARGLNPNNAADALLDSDGDGVSNRNEYLAGTDPGDPQSYLKVQADGIMGTNGFQIVWGSVSNKLYTIERSQALSPSGGTFTNLVQHILSTPPQNIFLDTTATNASAVFYRLKVE